MLPNPPKNIYGISFMLLNTMCLAVIDICAKYLRMENLSSGFIVFSYKLILFLFILPWVLKSGTQYLKTKRIWFHVFRAVLSVAAVTCWYQGLKFVHMADAAALENVQYLIVVLVGLVFFGEKSTKTKITALVIGFLGAIMVTNPKLYQAILKLDFSDVLSTEEAGFDKYKFTIIGILLWSVNTIIVKLLGKSESNKTQMFYLLLFGSIAAFPGAILKFEDINAIHLLGMNFNIIPSLVDFSNFDLKTEFIALLALMGLCYFLHGIAYFNALKHELSIVIPFRYTKLLFSAALGYLLFQEVEDTYSYLGYMMIIGSGLILFRYEFKKLKIKNK